MTTTPSDMAGTAGGERRLGPYTLLREAGRGGMATVYEAIDGRDGRTVAVKVLAHTSHDSAEEERKQRTRLSREAEAISRLRHPHVVEIYDVAVAGDTPETSHSYLVMEFVRGETLKERLLHGGPFSLLEASSVLRQVASALDAVHTAGVVHRDIKPANIMLLPDGTAKLMDFGLARLRDDTRVTRTGMVVGSPAYMSPEQAMGQPASAASDLWSLAVVLYEMVAGHPPFVGENIPATLYQVAYGAPMPLPEPLHALQPVFDRMLHRDPSKRFTTGGGIARAFEAARSNSAPAPPPSTPAPVTHSRNRKGVFSSKWLFAGAAAVIALPILIAASGVRNISLPPVASVEAASTLPSTPQPAAVPEPEGRDSASFTRPLASRENSERVPTVTRVATAPPVPAVLPVIRESTPPAKRLTRVSKPAVGKKKPVVKKNRRVAKKVDRGPARGVKGAQAKARVRNNPASHHRARSAQNSGTARSHSSDPPRPRPTLYHSKVVLPPSR